MQNNTRQFNFRVPAALKEAVDKKSALTRIGLSAIVTLTFEKWLVGEWLPERDVSDYNAQVLVNIDADLLAKVMLKRREAGTNVSAVAREGLRLWAEDEWAVIFG